MEFLTNEYREFAFPTGYDAVEFDMGCGRGGFTRDLVQRFPNRLILASDVMVGRLRQVEAKLSRLHQENYRLLRAESGMMVEYQLPWRGIDRLHLLCPDPWPKDLPKKGRRLASAAFLCLLPRILKKNGIFHFSSDEIPYVNDVKKMLDALPFFQDAPEALDDIRDIKTDFERQWEADGKSVGHLSYRVCI